MRLLRTFVFLIAAAVSLATVNAAESACRLFSVPVKGGVWYPVAGAGFTEGDKMQISRGDTLYELPVRPEPGYGFVKLPVDIATGTYAFSLVRGGAVKPLGEATLTLVDRFDAPARVIAHRGYWQTEGSAQNSRTAVSKALDLGIYGAEIDVWITRDGHTVVNHNRDIDSIVIENADFAALAPCRLANGETVAELREILDIVRASDSPTKLIIEIKEHSTGSDNARCARAVVEAVKAAGLHDRVEYISFGEKVLDVILQEDPEAVCAYLGNGLTPACLRARGHKGIDFNLGTLRGNPSLISDAHSLGMTVNVWTIRNAAAIVEANNMGVDFITTDIPEDAMILGDYFRQGITHMKQ